MSDCTIPTLIINNTDAVGDSAGKHNYNALVLDTNICNLSSQLFLETNNVNMIFQSLTSYINVFTQVASSYNEDRVYKMSEAATTVRILSSYWNKQEFSVQYPINGALLDINDTINAPALSTVNLVNLNKSVNTRLKPLANLYINSNFPATSFIDGTIINVNFFLYNISPDPANPNHLITFNATPNTFGYRVRKMNVTFFRDNVYLTKGINLRYYKQDNIWNYIGYNAGQLKEFVNLPAPTKPPLTIAPSVQSQLPTKFLKSFIYTSNSSIQIPIDVTRVLLLLVGGGGGGGAGSTTNNCGGGGGGGGISFGIQTVTPNTTYNIVIGNGGNGGVSGGTGINGGSTSFGGVTVSGGFGGSGGNLTSQGGPDGGGIPDGGTGGQGRTLTSPSSAGEVGFAYNDVSNYPTGTYFSGGGGGGGISLGEVTGGLGGGGDGGVNFVGFQGQDNTGGGGGGGGINRPGGRGGKGLVIISYYTNQ
jgi:hypothetical protein